MTKPVTPDRSLEDKLKAEWPGILRWMIDGCLDWQARGLVRPASVTNATAEYFSNQDLVGQWLADKCNYEPGNPSRWETSADLFTSWSDFAKAAGEQPGTSTSFGGKLARVGLVKSVKRLGSTTSKVWCGLNLKTREAGHAYD